MADDLVVAITGASGSPYGVRLLDVLLRAGRTVHLVLSPAATQVMERELGVAVDLARFDPTLLLKTADVSNLHYHHHRDFSAGIASGSFRTADLIPAHVRNDRLLREAVARSNRILVVGAGKAGAAMAEALEAALGEHVDKVTGIVNVPADAVRPLQRIALHAARPAASNH